MVAVLEIAAGVNPIMFCSQCGTESTSQNAAFCAKCGAALVTVESEPRATGLEDRIKRLERERGHPAIHKKYNWSGGCLWGLGFMALALVGGILVMALWSWIIKTLDSLPPAG